MNPDSTLEELRQARINLALQIEPYHIAKTIPKDTNIKNYKVFPDKILSQKERGDYLSGVKFDEDKPRWTLLPYKELESIVKVFTQGAKKYAPKNYLKLKKERIEDALIRHLMSYLCGEYADTESGEAHLSHVICNCLMLMEKKRLENE